MNVRYTISSLQNARNKHLIARRIARIPNITMTQALLCLEHLPAVIFHSVPYDEAKALEKDLKNLGCTSLVEPVFPQSSVPGQSQEKSEEKEETTSALKEEKWVPLQPSSFVYPPAKEKADISSQTISAIKQKPFFKSKKLSFSLGLIVFVLILMAGIHFFFGSSKISGPLDSEKMTQKEIQASIDKMESKLQKDSLNPEDMEKTADLYKKMALQLTAPAMQLQYLSRAIRLKSDDPQIRAMLAKTYVDTARHLFTGENAIRFYQMAISFNPYNEAAWDGLIEAYEKNGQTKEAESTRQKKERLLGGTSRKILTQIQNYGEVLIPPRTSDKNLTLGYATKSSNQDSMLKEAHELCMQLRKSQNEDSLTIFLFTPDGNEFSLISLLKLCPEKYEDWKKQIIVKKNN